MKISRGWRSVVAALVVVAASATQIPAQAMTIPVNTPLSGNGDQTFSDGDIAGYSVLLHKADKSSFIEFKVASNGAAGFGSGHEGATLADIDITSVSLNKTGTDTSVSPAATPITVSEGAEQSNSSPLTSGLHLDAFFASFAGLVSGTTYRLLLEADVLDTSAVAFGGSSDLFAGKISFDVASFPPALLLFVSGLLGMGILSCRRRPFGVAD